MQYCKFIIQPIFIAVMNNKIKHKKPPINTDLTDLLVKVGQNRDKKSFIKIFDHFAPRVKSYLIQNGISPNDADELVQNTMITVWQRSNLFDPKKSNASTWIFTVARNKKIDKFRKDKNLSSNINIDDLFSLSSSDTNVEESLIENESSKQLQEAIKDIPDSQAELIKMAYLDGKTHKDIADQTKLSLGTVKSRIRLGLNKLRKTIKQEKSK